MSVRSRIKDFEELAKANDGTNEKRNEAKKRFHYPGNRRTSESEEHPTVTNFSNGPHVGGKIKTQRVDEFEADLQAAWSVRKNIHHQGGAPSTQPSHSTSAPNVHGQAKAGQYSRHGAIPAQQTSGPKSVFAGKDKVHPLESRRSPLQEKNTPWNVKKTSYSYNSSEMATNKRPIESPRSNEIYSPPMAKRKGNAGIFDMVRPTNDQRTTQFTTQTGEHHDKSEKVSYAKRMAQSYLRSMGMGEWTPKVNHTQHHSAAEDDPKNKQASPSKAESGSTVAVAPKWNDLDDDDQDFDF